MWRNYLAAALRNLARNGLYAGVSIAGLAIGLAAALLIGLYVRNEHTYERFIPGHERTFIVSEIEVFPGGRRNQGYGSPPMIARPMRQAFPEIEWLARVGNVGLPPTVRRGEVVAAEPSAIWADPDFFKVFPLPAVAGDPATALDSPDGVVITRALAEKYFGREAAVGKTLLIDKQPKRVNAVIEDLPSNTMLEQQLFLSARDPQSNISQLETIHQPTNRVAQTYVRLRPGVRPETLEARSGAFMEGPLSAKSSGLDVGTRSFDLVPIRELHLRWGVNRQVIVTAIAAVGLLIVIVAAINFVTLMTARASRRAVEVGVRKTAGATRRQLIAQFLGEALVHVLIAGVFAMAIAELLLPAFNALVQRKIAFDYLHDPGLVVAILAGLVVTALLAGAYPAFVLSSFNPAAVLKGGPTQAGGGAWVRQGLVIFQFAVLIALILIAVTITRQTLYGLNEGSHVDKKNVVVLFSRPCIEPLRDEIRRLPGVAGAACASGSALAVTGNGDVFMANGRRHEAMLGSIDFGFLELIGVKPVAGRLFDKARAGDEASGAVANSPVILNETAVRELGFKSPAAAIGGRVLRRAWNNQDGSGGPPPKHLPSQVVGVIPDFTLSSMRGEIPPVVYSIGRNRPPFSVGIAVKLKEGQERETLAAIDGMWKRFGDGAALQRTWLTDLNLRHHRDSIIQGAAIATAAVIALVIAALGLFALSAFTTEQRTKEIGVRKAMGAGAGSILRMLMWRFTQPVLWANLVAWPAAYFVMRWWLNGFHYRVDLAPWTFAAAGAAALLIAWATVFAHALRVSRARPVGALRYE